MFAERGDTEHRKGCGSVRFRVCRGRAACKLSSRPWAATLGAARDFTSAIQLTVTPAPSRRGHSHRRKPGRSHPPVAVWL